MPEGRRLRAALIVLLLSSAALLAIGVATERHDIKRERARALADAAGPPSKTTSQPASHVSTTTAESVTVRAAKTESGGEHAADGSATASTKHTDAGAGSESAAKQRSESTGTPTATVTSSTGESAATLASERGGESVAHLRAETSNEQVFGINTESIPLVVAAVAVSILLAIALWLRRDLALVLLAVLGLGIVFAVFDVREAAHQASENRGALEAIAIVVALLHLAAAALAAVVLRKTPMRRAAAT